jgi:hypothetical protein
MNGKGNGMSRGHWVALLAVLAIVSACGEDEAVARWACINPSEEPFCQCEVADTESPDPSGVDACEGLQCCFASSDRCVCYGLTNLLSDCSLIQASDAKRVEMCPAS